VMATQCTHDGLHTFLINRQSDLLDARTGGIEIKRNSGINLSKIKKDCKLHTFLIFDYYYAKDSKSHCNRALMLLSFQLNGMIDIEYGCIARCY